MTHALLISSYLQLLVSSGRCTGLFLNTLRRKGAEGFFDDVTIFQFAPDVSESEIFQGRGIVLWPERRNA